MSDKIIESESEFRKRYESYHGRPVEWGVTHLSVPCSCEDDGGPWHWACVRNTAECIASHFDLESVFASNRLEDEASVSYEFPGLKTASLLEPKLHKEKCQTCGHESFKIEYDGEFFEEPTQNSQKT